MSHTSQTLNALEIQTCFEKNIAIVQNRLNALRASVSQKRARDISQILGLSEAQWVASQCGAIKSIRLSGKPIDVFKQFQRLGPVMALTRNDCCVHERHGIYQNIKCDHPVGMVLGPDIDLRMFYENWMHVWAVEENGRSSFQFFDHAGNAVHKVYCTTETHMAEYVAIVGEFAAEYPIWPERIEFPNKKSRQTQANKHAFSSEGELFAFRQAWLAMKDTHDFYQLLKSSNITRLGALIAVGEDFSQRVTPEVVEEMLLSVSKSGLPIMCFVANKGMIQIHSGRVENILRAGPWLNVMDEKFNLHLDTTCIASVWIVTKPTSDGYVTSMEVFAENGDLIVQFFGLRKPGSPELLGWRELMLGFCVEALPRVDL